MSKFEPLPYFLLRHQKSAAVADKPKLSKREIYDRNNERRREAYARNKAAGVCVVCRKKSAKADRTLCTNCTDKADRSRAQRISDLVDVGLCTMCGWKPPPRGGRVCKSCRAKWRAWSAKQPPPVDNECRRCKGPRDDPSRQKCKACRERLAAEARQRYMARISAGVCVKCEAPLNNYASRCDECGSKKS